MRASTLLLAALIAGSATATYRAISPKTNWTDEEARLVLSLGLSKLPPLPADPSNAVADDPRAADSTPVSARTERSPAAPAICRTASSRTIWRGPRGWG